MVGAVAALLVGRMGARQVVASAASWAARVGLSVAAVSWPALLVGAKLTLVEPAAPGDVFHLRASPSIVLMGTSHPLLHAAVEGAPHPPTLEAVPSDWAALSVRAEWVRAERAELVRVLQSCA